MLSRRRQVGNWETRASFYILYKAIKSMSEKKYLKMVLFTNPQEIFEDEQEKKGIKKNGSWETEKGLRRRLLPSFAFSDLHYQAPTLGVVLLFNLALVFFLRFWFGCWFFLFYDFEWWHVISFTWFSVTVWIFSTDMILMLFLGFWLLVSFTTVLWVQLTMHYALSLPFFKFLIFKIFFLK